MRRRVSEMGVLAWLAEALPGERLAYHRGVLASDMSPVSTPLAPPDRLELVHVARRLRRAAEQGQVHLFQQRKGPDDFTYVAIARPRAAAHLIEGSRP